MKAIRSKEFTADRAWGALDIANMGGVTTRLHWTDAPYKWHVNDGEEVFAVLDGSVDMHYREDGTEKVVTLEAGDVLFLPGSAASTWPIRAALHASSWSRAKAVCSPMVVYLRVERSPSLVIPTQEGPAKGSISRELAFFVCS